MKLSAYFKKHGIAYTKWAREKGLPGSSISLHLTWEEDASTGRRLGFDLSCQVVLATDGEVSLMDLVPDRALKLEQINNLPESQNA